MQMSDNINCKLGFVFTSPIFTTEKASKKDGILH